VLPSALDDVAVGAAATASAWSGRAPPLALELGRAVAPALPPAAGAGGR
jgi:hypothetical protein